MQTVSGIIPKLTIAGLVVGLSLIGWVARSSLAQDPAPAPRTLPDRGDSPAPPIDVDKIAPPQRSPQTTAEPFPSAAEAPPQLTVPTLPAPGTDTAPKSAEIGATSKTAVDATSSPPPTVVDDPEKAAQDFVQQNQKLAESQLKVLKDEAEKLRARLRKVEAGIKRWEALKQALEKSQTAAAATRNEPAVIPGVVVPGRPTVPDVETEPTELDPVSPGKPGPKYKT